MSPFTIVKMYALRSASLPLLLILVFFLDLPGLNGARLSYSRCGVCDKSLCAKLSYCEGEVIEDNCKCCDICSDNSFQPHISTPTQKDQGGSCKEVTCPKFKACVLNVQGLPLCQCPAHHVCRRSRKEEICGTDGMTYASRCLMKIASCNQGVKIRKMYHGMCKLEDRPADKKAYDKKIRSLKRRRKRRRMRRREREEKARKNSKGNSNSITRAQRRKEKKEKRRRRRRKINNKRKASKSRSRRHRKLDVADLAWENSFGMATWN